MAPSVAVDAGGNFAVVWESFGQDGNSFGVFGQRYASSGAPLVTSAIPASADSDGGRSPVGGRR